MGGRGSVIAGLGEEFREWEENNREKGLKCSESLRIIDPMPPPTHKKVVLVVHDLQAGRGGGGLSHHLFDLIARLIDCTPGMDGKERGVREVGASWHGVLWRDVT